MTEWLGRGLQNLLRRFESARHLFVLPKSPCKLITYEGIFDFRYNIGVTIIHLKLIMAAELITIFGTAVGSTGLAKFLGPSFEFFGKLALERLKALAGMSEKILEDAGVTPEPVEPKLFIPIAQAASLETNPDLIELWAALLANAANPKNSSVQLNLIEILRQLTPIDAALLAVLDRKVDRGYMSSRKPKFMSVDAIVSELPFDKPHSSTDWEVSIDNLIRLRLASTRKAQIDIDSHRTLADYEELRNQEIGITKLGERFYWACQPLMPKPSGAKESV